MAVDRVLARVSSARPRVKHVRVNLYVRTMLGIPETGCPREGPGRRLGTDADHGRDGGSLVDFQ